MKEEDNNNRVWRIPEKRAISDSCVLFSSRLLLFPPLPIVYLMILGRKSCFSCLRNRLEWTRVKINLKEPDRETAITLIEDVLHKTQEDDKEHVLLFIAYTVRQQLFKSKEIDVKTIKKLATWHPRCVEIDDDYTDYGWVTAYEDFKLDAKEDSDDDDDADEGFDEYVDDDEEVADDENFKGNLMLHPKS
ncbi:hypothetical protein ACLB2K_048160 [Fragaria x ananassa]